jgi:putative glutathione S-transferase
MSTTYRPPEPATDVQDARFVPEDLLRWELGGGREIRLARPDEFAEVGRVLQQAFSTGCWVTSAYNAHLADIEPRSVTAHVWVAADAEGILGAVLTPKPQYHRDEEFTFNILGVGPRGRGLDLGRQLTDHCVALARAWGYERLAIRSSPQMTAAHALYLRYGFVRRPEWETSVVDGGQRLYAFTYRVVDAGPRAPIPIEEPPRTWSFPNLPKEEPVSLTSFAPAGVVDPAGDFVPESPRRPGPVVLVPGASYRLVTSLGSVRGRPALAAVRLAGPDTTVSVELDDAAASPVLLTVDGDLVSDDWRFLPRAILDSTRAGRALHPGDLHDEIGTLDVLLASDIVGALERALFAGSDEAGRVAQRVFFARLGDLDRRLATRRYLLGDAVTEPDLTLFGVLIAFDQQYRARLGWGAASLADYPSLWAYARSLRRVHGLIAPEELVQIGLVAGPDGAFAEHWGTPPPVEGIADVRQAWELPDERVLPSV